MGVTEFQFIIMAGGKGSRMNELTARRPKCLLPVGNLPMIWYPIRLIERSGFQDVVVVLNENIKCEVQAALDQTGLKVHVEIYGIPIGEDWGTADTLRYLQENNKIKSDVVVLSCDLITDVNLTGLLNQFRQHDAALASLFCDPTPAKTNWPTPGPKSKDKTERDLVAIDPVTSRLVFLASASDYEETLAHIRHQISKHGQVRHYTRLLDAHVYVMKKWLCQYLTHNRNLSTLKGELVPYTVKKQFTRTSHDKTVQSNIKTELIELAEEMKLVVKARDMSNFSDHRGDENAAYHGDQIRCYATVAPVGTFAARVNTLHDYCRINREIVERWHAICGDVELTHVALNATVLSSQLEQESCIIGDSATVAERTAVKASVLGPHSSVKTRTRVFNSILMAGARIGEGCALVNCVLCDEAVVEDGCELKDCLVGSHYTVHSGGKHSSEVLTDDDHLIEVV